MKEVKTYKIMIKILLPWQHSRFQTYRKQFIKMDVISYERKSFKSLQQTLIQESITCHKHIESYFVPLGVEELKILSFELNGYGTENVVMAT